MSIFSKNGHVKPEAVATTPKHPQTELDEPIAALRVRVQAVDLAYDLANDRYFDEVERFASTQRSAAEIKPAKDGNITIPSQHAVEAAREQLLEARRVWETAATAKRQAHRRLTGLEARRMDLWREMELADPSNYHHGRVPETIQRIPR